MKIREQIAEVNNFAGRSLSVKEHDAWKDIKASMEAMLEVVLAAEALMAGYEDEGETDVTHLIESLDTCLAKLEGQL